MARTKTGTKPQRAERDRLLERRRAAMDACWPYAPGKPWRECFAAAPEDTRSAVQVAETALSEFENRMIYEEVRAYRSNGVFYWHWQ